MAIKSNYRKKSRKKFSWKFYSGLFVFLLLIGGVSYFLLFSSFFKVRNISVEGVQKMPPEEIISTCDDILSGRVFGIIPKNSTILLSQQQLKDKLFSKFPLIKEIKIFKKMPASVVVAIEERRGIITYCQSAKCFRLDEEGIAFEETPEIYGGMITTLKDNSNRHIELGAKAIELELIKFLLAAHKLLTEKINLNLLYFQINSYPSIEATAVTSEEWQIIFDITRSPEEQVDALKRVLEEKIKEGRDKLEYVDLRVENRAYYKIKN